MRAASLAPARTSAGCSPPGCWRSSATASSRPPGRHGAVQPPAGGRPARRRGGFAVLLLPYSLVGPFAGVLLDRWSRQRVLVRSQPGARAARRRRGRAGDRRGRGRPVLRGRARSSSRSTGSSSPRCRPRCRTPPTSVAGLGQRAVDDVGGRWPPSSAAARARAAAARRRRRPRVRADRAVCGGPLRSRPPRGRGFAGPSRARRTWSGRRRGARSEVARGLVDGARHAWPAPPAPPRSRDRRCTGSATACSTLMTLLLYRNTFDGERAVPPAGWPGWARSWPPARSAPCWRPSSPRPRSAGSASRLGDRAARRRRPDRAGARLPYSMPTLVLAALLLGFVAQGSRSAWTRSCRSPSTTTSAAGCSPSTTRCSTSRSSRRGAGRVVLPASGTSTRCSDRRRVG